MAMTLKTGTTSVLTPIRVCRVLFAQRALFSCSPVVTINFGTVFGAKVKTISNVILSVRVKFANGLDGLFGGSVLRAVRSKNSCPYRYTNIYN
jgi:hypothetical protein